VHRVGLDDELSRHHNSMKRKEPLTYVEHIEVGAGLQRMRDELLTGLIEIAGAYPKVSKVHTAADRAFEAVERLRCEMDSQLALDHPALFDPRRVHSGVRRLVIALRAGDKRFIKAMAATAALGFEGTAGDLLPYVRLTDPPDDYPCSAKGVARSLRDLQPYLHEAGISVEMRRSPRGTIYSVSAL
jgi:hypothetical protein